MSDKLKITTLHLKILATICMVIDHIACVFLQSDDVMWVMMRIIGRISAPLYWYCFVEGYKRTSDKDKYKIRLAVGVFIMGAGNCLLGLINTSVIPEMSTISPNIFLTFVLMAISMDAIERLRNERRLLCLLFWICLFVFSIYLTVLYADYGWIAAFSILCLYLVKNNMIKYTLFVVGNILICIILKNAIQIFMFVAIFPMMLCSNQKPKNGMKYFFYIFYPLHFWVLCLIKLFVG